MSRPQQRTRMLCATVIAVLALCGTARAQVVLINANWDANTPTYSYGYTYQQTGSSTFTAAATPGVGVGGSTGFRIAPDFTNATGTFWGSGGGVGQVPIGTPLQPVTSIGQFLYSFQASASGFITGAPTTTGVNISVQLLAPDGTLGPTDSNADQIAVLDLGGLSYNTVTGGFQSFSGNLASATFSTGSLAQLQTYASVINQAQFNINFNGGTDFGADNNNVIVFDNIVLSQVPEPSSLALVGLVGVGGWIRWRRSTRR